MLEETTIGEMACVAVAAAGTGDFTACDGAHACACVRACVCVCVCWCVCALWKGRPNRTVEPTKVRTTGTCKTTVGP
jgi:hypothetical protein